MNYSKIYSKLITLRKNSPSLASYTEKHHIIPKSLGGSDASENLVVLTAREHFFCHKILTKMYSPSSKEYGKMLKAYLMMMVSSLNQSRNMYEFNSKYYEKLRREYSKIKSNEMLGANNRMFGKMWISSIALEQRKLIEATEEVPEGWQKGRVYCFDRLKEIEKKKLAKRYSKEELRLGRREELSLWYTLYDTHGFKRFKSLTGYRFSQANLVTAFKEYLPHFKSASRIKRGTP